MIIIILILSASLGVLVGSRKASPKKERQAVRQPEVTKRFANYNFKEEK